jgi:hypothetical protein
VLDPFEGVTLAKPLPCPVEAATQVERRVQRKKILSEIDFGQPSSRSSANFQHIPIDAIGNVDCNGRANPVNIRFISSLDAEEELRLATAMLAGFAKLLDEFPIAYTIRLETAAGKVIEHHHVVGALPAIDAADGWQSPAPVRKSTSGLSKVNRRPGKPDGAD